VKRNILANGRPKNWEDQGMLFYTQNFQSKHDKKRK
jgi:hypothetical protein